MNLRVVPLPDRTSELIDALRLHMGRTQVRPGCISCRITQDASQKNVVVYQEEWSSWKNLEAEICSERFTCILELMEHSSNTPELTFSDVHEKRGIEYVRKLRLSN